MLWWYYTIAQSLYTIINVRFHCICSFITLRKYRRRIHLWCFWWNIKKALLSEVLLNVGERIRTPDLLVRSQTLYPAELRPHCCFVTVLLSHSKIYYIAYAFICQYFFDIFSNLFFKFSFWFFQSFSFWLFINDYKPFKDSFYML